MKKARRGFTLIEISFFLALTGALFVGIVAGTQNSLWQQKYNDSVQSFTNFLRDAYAQVANPQGIGDGRSDRAIYGKLIVFGQEYDLKATRSRRMNNASSFMTLLATPVLLVPVRLLKRSKP